MIRRDGYGDACLKSERRENDLGAVIGRGIGFRAGHTSHAANNSDCELVMPKGIALTIFSVFFFCVGLMIIVIIRREVYWRRDFFAFFAADRGLFAHKRDLNPA